MENSVFLVGWPQNGFSIGNPINAMMDAGREVFSRDPQGFNANAHSWHAGMIHVMREHGLRVLDIQPQYGGGDGVFTRDAFIYIDTERVVLSRFVSADRRPEVNNVLPIIAPQYRVDLEDKASFLEGGDCLPTPFDVTAIGFGPRTSFRAHEELRERFPAKNFLSLELVATPYDGDEDTLKQAEFYHADTAACFLPHGDLVIFRDAFTEPSWRAAEALARDNGRSVYTLNRREALWFSANIKALAPDYLLVPSTISSMADTWMRDLGYRTHTHNFEPFMLAGGGPHCLVHEVPYHMLTPHARQMLAVQPPAWAAKNSGVLHAAVR